MKVNRATVPGFHQKREMGPNPNGPLSVNCDRALRYSGLGGPVGDVLDKNE